MKTQGNIDTAGIDEGKLIRKGREENQFLGIEGFDDRPSGGYDQMINPRLLKERKQEEDIPPVPPGMGKAKTSITKRIFKH